MHDLLAILAGGLAALAAVPYIADTLKGRTRPNVVTWFTWTLLNCIIAIAALAAGAEQTAIFATAAGLCTGIVVLAGLLKDGFKQYTGFDVTCQLLAIIGIVLWRLTDRPDLAIVCAITASFVGSLPTYRHAWRRPREETWQFYAIDGLSAVVAVLAVAHASFTALGYPVFIIVSDVSILGVVLWRQKVLPIHQPVAPKRRHARA
jgi:hypothetical protein